jgi:multidrug transporter EmrE-like cation transporter
MEINYAVWEGVAVRMIAATSEALDVANVSKEWMQATPTPRQTF